MGDNGYGQDYIWDNSYNILINLVDIIIFIAKVCVTVTVLLEPIR